MDEQQSGGAASTTASRVRPRKLRKWLMLVGCAAAAGVIILAISATMLPPPVPLLSTPDLAASQSAPSTATAGPNAEQAFVRQKRPRSPDPAVVEIARKYLFDEQGKLKKLDPDYEGFELTLQMGALIEQGHGPGVLTLARDMCFPGQPITSQQIFDVCASATYVNMALVKRRDAVGSADHVYRSVAMAAFLQSEGRLKNGREFLDRLQQDIDRAGKAGADPREVAVLTNRVQALKSEIARGDTQTAAAIIGIIGTLAANPDSEEQIRAAEEYERQQAEAEKERRSAECNAIRIGGGGDREIVTSGCAGVL